MQEKSFAFVEWKCWLKCQYCEMKRIDFWCSKKAIFYAINIFENFFFLWKEDDGGMVKNAFQKGKRISFVVSAVILYLTRFFDTLENLSFGRISIFCKEDLFVHSIFNFKYLSNKCIRPVISLFNVSCQYIDDIKIFRIKYSNR